jgi:hypothetical protein
MSSTTQIVAARATAGTAYATALANFKAAYVALAAYDRVLVNDRVRFAQVLPGFGPIPDAISLRHAEAAPNHQGDWASDIVGAANAIMAGWPTPDA